MNIFDLARRINPLAKPIVHDKWTVRSIDKFGRPIQISAIDSWEQTYQHGLEVCPICAVEYTYKIS